MFSVTYEDLWTLCTFWDPEVCEPFEAFLGTRGTLSQGVVGEVMKERRRRERERLINLSTCGCMIQLYLWENTQFIEIREFGWGFLMLMS